jgi:citrate lyase subunit beta/citryl-CoA lyase
MKQHFLLSDQRSEGFFRVFAWTTLPHMRSKLFVPGSRPELFDKALAGDADALSFDLEDSVSPGRKADARQALQDVLGSAAARGSGKTLIARVNPYGSEHFEADVPAVVRPGLALLNLPKVESVDDVLATVRAVEAAERANGVTEAIGLLLNIETARGLRLAYSLAASHPRVKGLQLGLGDLFEPLQIARHEPAALHAVMLQLRLAAGEAGVFAYDAAYANFKDVEGFRAEAGLARRLGYLGKSCIHPSQVAHANAAFRPNDDEIAHARRVVAAADDAEARGVGAYTVDGQMVDAPFVLRARAVLATARRLGLA